jgi:hypothetical protein
MRCLDERGWMCRVAVAVRPRRVRVNEMRTVLVEVNAAAGYIRDAVTLEAMPGPSGASSLSRRCRCEHAQHFIVTFSERTSGAVAPELGRRGGCLA